ncbi:Arc family DNA-binding protein [Brytella acorum]|uniref:Arc family DNA-binding protein n=1 Tax=Brytella acorum TaxID=2959299 RepID=UPI0038D148B1
MTRVLLDRLKDAADERSHSMNAEIVHRLEESLYLSRNAHALEGRPDLTDDERAMVAAWRTISDEDRAALRVALRNAVLVSSRDLGVLANNSSAPS